MRGTIVLVASSTSEHKPKRSEKTSRHIQVDKQPNENTKTKNKQVACLFESNNLNYPNKQLELFYMLRIY